MAWIDDIDVLNNAATTADWNTLVSYYDSPTLNDSTATTPIYLEGSACMWWPLKKGGTDGYTGTAVITGTPSMTGRIIVGFLNYPFADIDNIPITDIQLRMSSSTGFVTNYAEWDALAQLTLPKNTPISGHTPIMGYPDGATETGSPNYGSIESVGWVATTGNTNDGKQGGFDWLFVASWLGAHSATLNGTFFSGLYSEYYDNEGNGLPGETSRPVGVLSRSGDFYQTNVNFQLGDGTSDTADIIVTETGKTIYFNNVHANHNLGYVFVNPASTNELEFTITNCVHFWNEQDGTSPHIFTDATNCDKFLVGGCSFSRGGDADLQPHISDSLSFVIDSTFNDCGQVFTNTIKFEGNTISDATVGVLVESTSHRMKNNTYTGCTHAMEFDTAGTYTLDGDQFSSNTWDVLNSSTGLVTINLINGANASTFQNTGGGSTVINNNVLLKVTVQDTAGSSIQNARAIIADTSTDPDTLLMNELTTVLGVAEETFNYGAGPDVDVEVRVRNGDGGTNYKPVNSPQVITASGLDVTITLEFDPNNATP